MTTTTINNNNNTKSTITLPFQGDPSLLLPDDDTGLWNGAGDGFHCREYLGPRQPPPEDDDDDDEYWDDDRPVVWFQCTIPTITTAELPETSSTTTTSAKATTTTTTTTKMVSLTFECLEPSCDVLMQDEKSSTPAAATGAEKDYDYDGAMDPFFFDPGYTLAGKTGFQIWPGSRLLVEALLVPLRRTTTVTNNTNIRLVQWQERIQNPKEEKDATIRILELGSGVGMVGTSMAAVAGAHVLLTDLKTLVENSTQPNLQRNSTSTSTKIPDVNSCWLTKHHMKNMVSIGKGWAATTPIDWTIPLLISTDTSSSDQNQNIQNQLELEDIQNIDLILASDCIWLVSMMEPLFDIVDCIFTHNPQAKFLLSFQRRDGTNHEDNDNDNDDPKTTTTSSSSRNNTKMFTTVDSVLKTMMEERKWSVQCLAWRPTNTTNTTTTTDNQDPKEVFLFEASVDRT